MAFGSPGISYPGGWLAKTFEKFCISRTYYLTALGRKPRSGGGELVFWVLIIDVIQRFRVIRSNAKTRSLFFE